MGTNFLVLLFLKKKLGGLKMDLRNVYVGMYKNSDKETLFYQKTLMRYIDLMQNDKEVYASEINLDSLISFQDAIPIKSTKLGTKGIINISIDDEKPRKKYITKLYLSDRKKIISLDKVSIGDIYRVNEILNRNIQNHKNQGLMSADCYTTFRGVLIKQGALLINEGEFFKDMEHSIIVKRNQYPEVGELVVIENDQLILTPPSKTRTEKMQPFTSMVPMTSEAPKEKILEEYRKHIIWV